MPLEQKIEGTVEPEALDQSDVESDLHIDQRWLTEEEEEWLKDYLTTHNKEEADDLRYYLGDFKTKVSGSGQIVRDLFKNEMPSYDADYEGDNIFYLLHLSHLFDKPEQSLNNRLTIFRYLEENYKGSGLITDISLLSQSEKSFTHFEDERQFNYFVSSQLIADKCVEILGSINEVENYFNTLPSQESITESDIVAIREILFKKTYNLLLELRDYNSISKVHNFNKPQQLFQELNEINTELLVFTSVFKGLVSQGHEITLDNFKKYSYKVLPAPEIDQSTRNEMSQILATNWQSQDQKFADYALDSLEQSFANPECRYYILKFDNEMLGFMRFDHLPEGEFYAGSFNINPTARGSKVGEAALKAYLSAEAQNRIIHADVSPNTPITQRYIGDFGFVGTGIKNIESRGKNFSLLEMERNDQSNSSYRFQNRQAHEKAVSLYRSNQYEDNAGVVILRFNSEDEYHQMLFEADQILKTGQKVMTAYFRDGQNPEYRYLVFEPVAVREETPRDLPVDQI